MTAAFGGSMKRKITSLVVAGLAVALEFAGPAGAEQPKPAAPAAQAAPAAPAPDAAPAAQAPAAQAPAAKAPDGKQPTVDGWQTEKDPRGITLDDKQTEVVKVVSKYFSDLKGMKGAFVQTGADNKKMKGKFFVMRPGRFRFNYALPSKQIIISDGEYLAIQDLDLNNEDRVALDQTPFRLLLRKDVDLLRDARIIEVQQAEDLIVLGIQDKSPDTPGRIKLFLSTKPTVELKEWVTTDAQGLDTRIEVSELAHSDDLDGNMFKIQMLEKKPGLQ
ncbi:MAG: outer-membrane lipoprotein carrier protein LolA [Hyphomicrobium sp.]